MQKVNAEGLYGCVQACLPQFAENRWQARIVVVCPPIYERFFRGKTAYAMGKVGMSVLVKGLVSTRPVTLCSPLRVDERSQILPQGHQATHLLFASRKTADVKSLKAMDFKREGKTGMAVTGIWPASVSPIPLPSLLHPRNPCRGIRGRNAVLIAHSLGN